MARPVISNIRRGDPDGNEWNLTVDFEDDFFAVNADDPDAYDALIARLNLEDTGLDLSDYGYVFLGTNKQDTITGVDDGEEVEGDISGVIASGNGSDDVTAGPGDHVIFAGNGMDSVSGGAGNDIIFGENGKDQLGGNAGDDEVHGGKGKDAVNGGAGEDTLTGNNGKDILNGGEDGDTMSGGRGGDEFHWTSLADFGDVVSDFTAGEDKLVFDVEAADDETEELEITIGNDDTVVDDGEVVINTDDVVLTADIQTAIDGNGHTTATLFAFIEDGPEEGDEQAVLYYDDPNTDGDAVLVAEFPNITTLEQLGELSASDFMFV
jgi:Ca2+-binding RTX toxin-like protein